MVDHNYNASNIKILEGLESLMNNVDKVHVSAMEAEAFAQSSSAQYHFGRIVNMCKDFQNAYNKQYISDIIEIESYLNED